MPTTAPNLRASGGVGAPHLKGMLTLESFSRRPMIPLPALACVRKMRSAVLARQRQPNSDSF
jgi:hypothetical protein